MTTQGYAARASVCCECEGRSTRSSKRRIEEAFLAQENRDEIHVGRVQDLRAGYIEGKPCGPNGQTDSLSRLVGSWPILRVRGVRRL